MIFHILTLIHVGSERENICHCAGQVFKEHFTVSITFCYPSAVEVRIYFVFSYKGYLNIYNLIHGPYKVINLKKMNRSEIDYFSVNGQIINIFSFAQYLVIFFSFFFYILLSSHFYNSTSGVQVSTASPDALRDKNLLHNKLQGKAAGWF